VTFYLLARALTRDTPTAFVGGLLFSLFSPSVLFVPVIRTDVGGTWHARRLQALAVYGEGPNVTGLMLAMLALAMVHRALTRKTPLATCLAALAVAAVPATSWPATIALIMALVCYVAALDPPDLRGALSRLLVIGVGAFCFAAPFAPPSTILGTFAQANVMDDGPTPGPGRWIALGLMMVALIVLRGLLAWRKAPFHVRFPLIWFLLTGWIVVTASATGIRTIPYPVRFHLAMEIPFLLAVSLCAVWMVRRWSVLQRPAIAILAIFCCLQTYNYRKYAHSIIHPLNIEKTSEYQVGQWAEANMHGQRIFTRGTFGFWINAFTSTPQVSGFFDQSITNFQDRVTSYLVSAGYRSDRESADYSLLWLKAWAADAIQMGGPNTTNVYKDYQFPYRFRNVLPLLWSRGDDYIYRVPERAEGLARAVQTRDLMAHAPANGIDVVELRPFVAALDDPALPVAHFAWKGTNDAIITGSLAPEHAISVALNYDPGWTATSNGRPVTLRADGMGMIAIEPQCSGNCEIRMHWSQGWEPPFVISAFLLALGGSIAACILLPGHTMTVRPPGPFEAALRTLPMPDSARPYFEKHIDRLAKTLALVPPPLQTGRALELGCYMQITPFLNRVCGYKEVRGAYFGKAGITEQKTVSFPDGDFNCSIDLFDADRDRFPYPDGHFDLVVAGEILEHMIFDPMHLLVESRRVLCEGGYLLVSTPNAASLACVAKVLDGSVNPQIYWQYKMPDPLDPEIGHVHEYTAVELGRTVAAAGFEIASLFTTVIGEYEGHSPLLKLLADNGYTTENRGEQTWCLAIKRDALPVNRYPDFLYS
jgi:SAM-dependent methyltransferase